MGWTLYTRKYLFAKWALHIGMVWGNINLLRNIIS